MADGYEMHAMFGDEAGLWDGLIGLARETFGIELGAWYRAGYANANCLPYVFTDQGQVVAGLLAHRLEVVVDGFSYQAVQLGTVMTHPDHRGQGLAGELLKDATRLRDVDFFFLFANRGVVELYPKYGFQAVPESRFWVEWKPGYSHRRRISNSPLDPITGAERVRALADQRAPVSRWLGVTGDLHLAQFYCLSVFPEYVHDLGDCLAVYQAAGETFHLYDVISPRAVNLAKLLQRVVPPDTTRVEFHFTPELEEMPVQAAPLADPDSILFMRPACSPPGPFRFPVTSQA